MSEMAAADYLWYLRTAARHFWAGAIEEQMLWASYEPSPGDVTSAQKAVDDVLSWSTSQSWGGMSATLLDGGHDNKEHWSNKLACKDLQQRLHERIARDLNHFRGKIRLYEVRNRSPHARGLESPWAFGARGTATHATASRACAAAAGLEGRAALARLDQPLRRVALL